MINNIFIFAVALFMVVKGATLATRFAGRLAESFHLSRYTVGFIIVAVISILPEMFISISSSLKGIPSFGLGMLFGGNIADMTLLFALLIFLSGRSLKIESKILKNHVVYPFLLLLPLVLGLNGHFSRIEGVVLILVGIIFYYFAFKDGLEDPVVAEKKSSRKKNFIFLTLSLILLLVGSHFTVTSATTLATLIGVSPILIGMLIVGLGTTIPEFAFSLKAVKSNDDSLAVGDLLGTVLADATIVVGILVLVNPFFFPVKIIYVTGALMVIASFVLFYFMRTGKTISRREAFMLFGFWIFFVLVEFIVNK